MKVISSKEEQGMDVGSTLVRYLLDRGREERKLVQCICWRVESEKKLEKTRPSRVMLLLLYNSMLYSTLRRMHQYFFKKALMADFCRYELLQQIVKSQYFQSSQKLKKKNPK